MLVGRGGSAVFAGCVLGALGSTASGQMVWKKANPRTSPPRRTLHAMAFHSSRGVTVMFGGQVRAVNGYWGLGQDTWEYDGTTWVQNTFPGVRPSARYFHTMAYDAVRRVVVLFGGRDLKNLLNDTWEYDGFFWRQRTPKTSPPALVGHSMVYDRARGAMVVFGGNKSPTTQARSDETWEWNGTNWLKRALSLSPTARHGHAMAYDAARRVVVLVGGSAIRGLMRDTWEWDGENAGWIDRTGAIGPPSTVARMVYDEARRRTVWFGNRPVAPRHIPDLWEWDGVQWRQGNGSVFPPRAFPGMAYDAKRRRVVVFSGGAANDTWEYYPTHRGTATRVGVGCAGSSGIPTLAANGPPILGNRDFRVRIDSARATSSAFVALSPKPANLSISGCTLFLDVLTTRPILLTGRTNGAGVVEFPMPIPFNLALSGFRIEAQGFVHDANGRFFRSLAFTHGLRLLIGD